MEDELFSTSLKGLVDLLAKETHKAAAVDTLVAVVEQGPVWAGDLPSKTGRDLLIRLGLAVQTLVKGEDGYTAVTTLGRNVYCHYFGQSDTVAEAKANRIAGRTINSAIYTSKLG